MPYWIKHEYYWPGNLIFFAICVVTPLIFFCLFRVFTLIFIKRKRFFIGRTLRFIWYSTILVIGIWLFLLAIGMVCLAFGVDFFGAEVDTVWYGPVIALFTPSMVFFAALIVFPFVFRPKKEDPASVF